MKILSKNEDIVSKTVTLFVITGARRKKKHFTVSVQNILLKENKVA